MQEAILALSVFGGIGSCLGVILLFVYRMRRQDLEFKYGKMTTDINQELTETIKTEFMRLRAENAEFRNRLEALEHKQGRSIALSDLTPAGIAEIQKQIEAEKHRN
jgi:hypothetical protein